jgi:hypothetical protein
VAFLSPGFVRNTFAGELTATVLRIEHRHNPGAGLGFKSSATVVAADDLYTSSAQTQVRN